MTTTSASLLERLRAAGPASADWQWLYKTYAPFVRSCLRWSPALAADADDIVQDVFVVLVRELPHFRRQRDGSFRTWLRRVTVNRVREWRRARNRQPATGLDLDPADEFLLELEDPAGDRAREWDLEHDRRVFARLLELVRPDFKPATWEAFRLSALDGLPVAAVAEKLGTSENAVTLAKSRVLKRLREEEAGLID